MKISLGLCVPKKCMDSMKGANAVFDVDAGNLNPEDVADLCAAAAGMIYGVTSSRFGVYTAYERIQQILIKARDGVKGTEKNGNDEKE